MRYLLYLNIACYFFLSIQGCAEEDMSYTSEVTSVIEPHLKAQLLLSSIEYDLYMLNKVEATYHSEDLHTIIVEDCDLFCTDQNEKKLLFLENLESYTLQIVHNDREQSLLQLRKLKSQFSDLNAAKYDDIFFQYLWNYEKIMYQTTTTAMDPMLDLLDWKEFEMMVICMNEEWNKLITRQAPLELFNNNNLAYKLQISSKIDLQYAIASFNQTVASDDYERFNLCDHAYQLRTKYIIYLQSITDQSNQVENFLNIKKSLL